MKRIIAMITMVSMLIMVMVPAAFAASNDDSQVTGTEITDATQPGTNPQEMQLSLLGDLGASASYSSEPVSTPVQLQDIATGNHCTLTAALFQDGTGKAYNNGANAAYTFTCTAVSPPTNSMDVLTATVGQRGSEQASVTVPGGSQFGNGVTGGRAICELPDDLQANEDGTVDYTITCNVQTTLPDGVTLTNSTVTYTLTVRPIATPDPTVEPTEEPTPTPDPTVEPTEEPTPDPTVEPTEEPTPTPDPTVEPTEEPTPTPDPTVEPTEEPTPTPDPTVEPTEEPTPTPDPTVEPTEEPTPTPLPTVEPTEEPTPAPLPTVEPTEEPIFVVEPTADPTPQLAPPEQTSIPGTTDPTPERLRLIGEAPEEVDLTADPDGTQTATSLGLNMEPDASEATEWFETSNGRHVVIVDQQGKIVEATTPVATGMKVELIRNSDGAILDSADIVVPGDVLGIGRMNLTQLVRMAKALKTDPLNGVYFEAGDYNNDGLVSITDLVQAARLYIDICM